MRLTLSRQMFSAAGLVSLLALLLLPAQSALAGGCCFTRITIISRDTGHEFLITGPALTAGYDISTFFSFTDFSSRTTAPARPGPAYEVDRNGWDHLLYYPGVAGAPGAVYYEGLYGGSSEYDRQWFAVPPAQDAALRQVLATEGLTPTIARQPAFWVLAVFTLAVLGFVGLYLVLGLYTRPPTGRAFTAAAARAVYTGVTRTHG